MKKAGKQTQPRIGRPPRTDDPRRLTIILPGEMRRWLRVHAATVEQDMGDIVTEALAAYRERLKRTRERKGAGDE